MGQNAFLERYEKPNYRLHVIIFAVIVAISVFLATQVEKSKENANVAALKSPVPIDSVTLTDKASTRQVTPTVKPSVTKAPVASKDAGDRFAAVQETGREYAFEEQQSDQSARDQLAQNTVTDQESAENKATETEPVTNELSDEQLEEVFDQQHDRFLQTLAKTADIDSKESAEVRKIKQAIRQDKPLSTATTSEETKPTKEKKASSTQLAETTISKQASPETTTQARPSSISPQARTADNSAVPVAMRRSQSVPPAADKPSSMLTTKELNRILSNFTNSYNKGNIGQLMSLFDENARTNDRSSKRGIQADYAELFSNTQSRKLMLNDVNWRVRQGKAEGVATFEVVVQPKNSTEASRIRGSIRIVAEKNAQGVYIKRLVHDIQQ